MKTVSIAIAAALAAAVAAPALAEPAAAPAAAATALSVETTLIGDILKNEKAKAILDKELPPLAQYYDQIGGMTLSQLAPMSQGMLDDAKLKSIQAQFDAIK